MHVCVHVSHPQPQCGGCGGVFPATVPAGLSTQAQQQEVYDHQSQDAGHLLCDIPHAVACTCRSGVSSEMCGLLITHSFVSTYPPLQRYCPTVAERLMHLEQAAKTFTRFSTMAEYDDCDIPISQPEAPKPDESDDPKRGSRQSKRSTAPIQGSFFKDAAAAIAASKAGGAGAAVSAGPPQAAVISANSDQLAPAVFGPRSKHGHSKADHALHVKTTDSASGGDASGGDSEEVRSLTLQDVIIVDEQMI